MIESLPIATKALLLLVKKRNNSLFSGFGPGKGQSCLPASYKLIKTLFFLPNHMPAGVSDLMHQAYSVAFIFNDRLAEIDICMQCHMECIRIEELSGETGEGYPPRWNLHIIIRV